MIMPLINAHVEEYPNQKAINPPIIIGGGIVLLWGACELINSYKIIKLIGYTVLGVLVGLLIGIPIFTGIAALIYGLYKS